MLGAAAKLKLDRDALQQRNKGERVAELSKARALKDNSNWTQQNLSHSTAPMGPNWDSLRLGISFSGRSTIYSLEEVKLAKSKSD